MLLEYGMVAQLAERKIEALGVGSSILSHSTSDYDTLEVPVEWSITKATD